MEGVKELLAKLAAKEPHFKLHEGIEAKKIEQLSKAIGQEVPSALLEILSAADGEDLSFTGMIGDEKLLSSEEIAAEFETHVDLYAGGELGDEGFMSKCPYIIHGRRWRRGWIPIVGGEEATAYLDTCPSALGRYGQILLIDIPSDVCHVIGKDIRDMLQRALKASTEEVLLTWPAINPVKFD